MIKNEDACSLLFQASAISMCCKLIVTGFEQKSVQGSVF